MQSKQTTKVSNTRDRLMYIMETRGLRAVDIVRLCKPYSDLFGTNIVAPTISEYLSGKCEPGNVKLAVLGNALNVSEPWLMGYDVPMEREKGIPTDDVSRDAEEFTRLFLQLDRNQQEAVMALLRSFASNQG